MTIDFRKDIPAPQEPGQNSELALLIEQLEEACIEEEELERKHKSAKKTRVNLEEKLIPDKLSEMGIYGAGSKIRLTNGKEISLTEQTYVSIPASNKERAYAWLKENGYGALVKTETKENVSPGALRPMADDLPDSIFKINPVKKVKIKNDR